jgi:hypothetical protein
LVSQESPNKKFIASKFKRDCGMTTAFSYHLIVLEHSENIGNTYGNIFRSKSDFSFKWLDSDHILVIHDKSAEVFKNEKQIGDIKITYSNP